MISVSEVFRESHSLLRYGIRQPRGNATFNYIVVRYGCKSKRHLIVPETRDPLSSMKRDMRFSGDVKMRSTQAVVAVAMFMTFAGTLAVAAQELQLRTVQGKVIDPENRAVASAVVYLRDDRTDSVRTCITNLSGDYRFSWLGKYDDYELGAHTESAQSSRRHISQWDTRNQLVINLKLHKKQN